MKTIVAGSRVIKDYLVVLEAIKESKFEISEVVCGEANGVDEIGKIYANDFGIKVASFPAKWDDLTHPDALIKLNKYGKKYDARAGFRRNEEMAVYADALILVWDGESPGSANMLETAEKHGLKIFQKIV